jgi:hypothetical protein
MLPKIPDRKFLFRQRRLLAAQTDDYATGSRNSMRGVVSSRPPARVFSAILPWQDNEPKPEKARVIRDKPPTDSEQTLPTPDAVPAKPERPSVLKFLEGFGP